jgi:hypothetical protein|tara:strand:+ start:489 stop:692 length:204 start_codon:yes stop_codon:yes gene_type:complete
MELERISKDLYAIKELLDTDCPEMAKSRITWLIVSIENTKTNRQTRNAMLIICGLSFLGILLMYLFI